MSSSDVFPARNLGSAENWGRTTENRVRSSESQIEALTQRVDQLSLQLGGLAGQALTAISRIPEPLFQSTLSRNQGVSVATTWITLLEQDFSLPEGTSQIVATVSGTVQLTGTDPSNDAPWVRARIVAAGGYVSYFPDSQGVRAASNSGAVFLATVSGSDQWFIPADLGSITILLEVWCGSASDFATPASSNLSSLNTLVSAYPEPVVSSGS